MPLIVTGSIGIDTIETPDGRADDVVGGSAIYFAAAASYFGDVRLVGAVGEDFPDEHVELFTHFGVDTAGLERRAGSKTFRWHGKYHENMNDRDTLGIELGVIAEALPPVPEAFADSRHVFLATTTPGNQLELLDAFPSRELVMADTIELYIEQYRDELVELFGRIDGVVINDIEAKMLTGESNVIKAADAVRAMGPKFVVVKKGEHGAMVSHSEGYAVMPAFPAKDVVDPTGAGDTFAAGMMGYLAAAGADGSVGLDTLRTAMAFGTVVASYTIEAFSVKRLLTLKREEIDERFAAFKDAVNINA
ncbi:MAG: PfkB family carbohydrate kinase [Planctomycetota bacterium]